jgi:uncharacterized membrane protein YjgN (DUF898 family)
MDVIEKAGSKQCPACSKWDVYGGATIEDGGIGDWCPHCKKSLQKMRLDMKNQAKSITRVIPIEFTGKGGEYFRIWIVNAFLSLITLGIYSAWAKVRNKRYLYGNTLIESVPFEYLAKPKQILKGRFIVFSILAVYSVTIHFVPFSQTIFGIVFMFLIPWLFIKARSFNLRHSSYRNIRFNFKARYLEAFYVFFWMAGLAGLTLGIAYPFYVHSLKELQVKHSRYGTAPFHFDTKVKSFYSIYLKVVCLVIVLIVMTFVFVLIFQLFMTSSTLQQEAAQGKGITSFIPLILMFTVFLLIRPYAQTHVTNFVWNNSDLGEHSFESTLKPSQMIWITFSNVLAILFSVGLLIPWAKIRMIRYRLKNLRLHVVGNLDGFIVDEFEKVGAVGDEIADFIDFDIWI